MRQRVRLTPPSGLDILGEAEATQEQLTMEQWTIPDFEEVPVNSECTAYSGVSR